MTDPYRSERDVGTPRAYERHVGAEWEAPR